VTDPDGVEWEVYHLNYDLEGEEATRDARTSGLTMAPTTACCGGA
jgi:hypothetical protein